MTSKTAAVLTLGCRLNQADSALIQSRLRRMGFQLVSAENADASPNVIVVNSCAVTATALKKSMQALRSIRSENPQSFLVFTGCAATLEQEKLENCSDIDLLLPNERKAELETLLPRYLAYLDSSSAAQKAKDLPEGVYLESALTFTPFKTRATLKIQDGCDNRCSYCVVPRVRGHERSRETSEVLSDFRALVNEGFREIVLSGCNLCRYRCGKTGLPGLLELLLKEPGEWRIRLGSAEPGEVLPDVLKLMAGSDGRICQFLHMPLQHGADAVLKTMNRYCLTEEYASYADLARKLMPSIHLGTDIIVGHPGETEALFQESVRFLETMRFANLHVFPYSPRPDTPASVMEQIPRAAVEARLEKMKLLKAHLAADFLHSLQGREETVLTELRKGPAVWEGWSGNYVRTQITARTAGQGDLVKVRFGNVLPSGALSADVLP
ncbi:MAG: tRNA (N(6)-L-threonylcarbamoyladenosine(37)-C(2))-methylthiotransferase MtaB [Lentisphaeria bacterium]|nr:tRNA (N(6)-L-threonylcarbamoyladenosine(37)-C(2))-methylthiotransferase MtaB [Lentisphaeria bacterium]